MESDLVLEIQAKDELSDAIDSNLILEASAINIKGNVGKNVILVAKEITIEGKSTLKAMSMPIKRVSLTIRACATLKSLSASI